MTVITAAADASMVDVMPMRALLAAVPDRAALLIVGDIDQLLSVGPGQVLAHIIASGIVPVVRLTEVFRQAARSRIVTSGYRENARSMPADTRLETKPAWSGGEAVQCFLLGLEDLEYGE